jgi:hypothetical protein
MSKQATNTIAAADLVQAIAQISNLAANKVLKTDKFTSKYVTLDVILDYVKPILADNGLALKQSLVAEDGRIGIATSIIHNTGETFDFGRLLVKPEGTAYDKNTGELKVVPFTAQQVGSALSYIRRVSICVALSLAVDTDDDAASASTPRVAPSPAIKTSQTASQTPQAATKASGYTEHPEAAVRVLLRKGWLKEGQGLADLSGEHLVAIANNPAFNAAVKKEAANG